MGTQLPLPRLCFTLTLHCPVVSVCNVGVLCLCLFMSSVYYTLVALMNSVKFVEVVTVMLSNSYEYGWRGHAVTLAFLTYY